ncbi:amino acid adenylation domain-containing protein [Psychromicrobium sp. YIM B11713]|uniref:amino acid adenylation domain-containing protein n=1 Tax=Psychromicrobium sp. YIM B11713 TaxID=3145233 RepID=UPI00374E6C92
MSPPHQVSTFSPLGAGLFQQASVQQRTEALRLGETSYSYGRLAATALRWASALISRADRPLRRVGILAYRNEVSYIGVAAALAAGAAFVPLNPKYPVQRTRAMVEAADLDAILVDALNVELLSELSDVVKAGTVIGFPQSSASQLSGVQLGDAVLLDAAALHFATPLPQPISAEPDDLAYLLFTSGTTGAPKGVPISHRNVRAHLSVNQRRYRISTDDRLSQTFEQTFDLSVFDMFMAWEHGATLCPADPIELLDPASYVARHGLTVWFSVPSVITAAERASGLKPASMPSLRLSLFCGEALTEHGATVWQAAAANSILENLYGPTELTIACSAYRWDPVLSPQECVRGNVPIGELYEDMVGFVLDERDLPVSPGEAGELCVTGSQMTAGYWRAPQLDEGRFVEVQGLRCYRTGDLVVARSAGLIHLGRLDHQVQVGGHRVELGEVEAAMRAEGCLQAVCVPTSDGAALHGFVIGEVPADAFRRGLAARLPSYMVPRTISYLEEFPLNANGKIDRGALTRMLNGEKLA